jgi:hypothetical protein
MPGGRFIWWDLDIERHWDGENERNGKERTRLMPILFSFFAKQKTNLINIGKV